VAKDAEVCNEDTANQVRDKAEKYPSQSNGSLMRMTPMAVYLSLTKDDNLLARCAMQEASLTHGSKSTRIAAACYCFAVRELLTNFGDREGAYQAAKKWAENIYQMDVASNSKAPTKLVKWFKLIDKTHEKNQENNYKKIILPVLFITS